MRRARLLPPLLVLCAACHHAPPPVVVANEAGIDQEIAAIASEVAEVYGAPWVRPVQVRVVDDAEFRKQLTPTSPPPGARSRFDAALIAFGLQPPGGLVAAERAASAAASYLPSPPQLLIPRGMVTSAQRRRIYAHELTHALEDQTVGLERFLSGSPSFDGRLARRSVTEGVADLVADLVVDRRFGVSDAEVIQGKRAVLLPVTISAQSGRFSLTPVAEHLVGGHPFPREVIQFPYFHGYRFALDTYLTGGMALVRDAVAHPPESTRAVLHPQRYFDGAETWRMPRPIDVLSSGSLGEALLTALVEPCQGATVARRLGWLYEGDGYSVRQNADGSIWLAWSTHWGDAESAAYAESLLRTLPACWEAIRTRTGSSPGDPAPAISDAAVVIREGARLVLIRGDPPQGREAAAAEELAIAGIPPGPARPPFGPRKVPAVGPLLGAASIPGLIFAARYHSDWLGIRSDLPPEARATAPTRTGALLLERSGPGWMIGFLAAFTRPLTPRTLDAVTETALAVYEAQLGEQPPWFREVSHGEVNLGWARAEERVFERPGKGPHLRLHFVPICDGAAFLAFTEAWGEDSGRAILDTWLRDIRIEDRHPKGCPKKEVPAALPG